MTRLPAILTPRRLMGAAIVLAVGALLLVIARVRTAGPPSDGNVRQVFLQHRPQCARLCEMIRTEPTVAAIGTDNIGSYFLIGGHWERKGDPQFRRYSMDEVLEAVGLPSERYAEYERLLNSLGAYRVTKGDGGRVVRVHLYRTGTLVDGYTKDVVCLPEPPNPLVTDTDAPEHQRDNTVVYAEIGDGWYIEAERD